MVENTGFCDKVFAGDDGRRMVALREIAGTAPLRIKVRGRCMSPTLQDGQVVDVERCRFYLPGDIVAYLSPQPQLVVHRLLGYRLTADGWALVTQADSAARPDNPVLPDQILGRVGSGSENRGLASLPLRLRALIRFAGAAFRALHRRLIPSPATR